MTSCHVCKLNVTKVKAPGLQCDGKCKLFFHFKCSNIAPDHLDPIEKRQVQWKCNKCKSARNSMILGRRDSVASAAEDVPNIVENNSSSVQENLNRIEIEEIKKTQSEIKDSIQLLVTTVEEMNSKIGTYAKLLETMEQMSNRMNDIDRKLEGKIATTENQVESFVEILKRKPSKPLFILRPIDAEQTSDATQAELRNVIDPIASNIRGTRQIKNGGVLITCEDSSSSSKCQEDLILKLGEKYNVKPLQQNRPLLKIVGLYAKMSEDQLVSSICAQNDSCDENSRIKLVEMKIHQNGVTAIIETDITSYENILITGRLNVEFERCRVFPYIRITRCFKCQEYGHIAKYCKKSELCGKCGEEHNSDHCTSNAAKCVNCSYAKEVLKINQDIDVHHYSWSVKCPVYKRKQMGLLNKSKFRD